LQESGTKKREVNGIVFGCSHSYHMLIKRWRGKTTRNGWRAFMAGRRRIMMLFASGMLHGREQMWSLLPRPEQGVWVDFGGGTGRI
jgi:hypothetical protein